MTIRYIQTNVKRRGGTLWKKYVKALFTFLSENPPVFTHCRMDSLIQMLYCCYGQQSNGDSQEIKAGFAALDSLLKGFNIREQDRVVDITCQLSRLHHKEGFEAGVAVGFYLFHEMEKEKSSLG